jgi:MFS family permease
MTAPYSGAQTPAPTSSSKTLGIVSVVLSAISLLGFLILPIGFILFAIAGVIVGFLSRKREPGARTLSLVGIILGFVGIAVCILSIIIGAIAVASLMNSM